MKYKLLILITILLFCFSCEKKEYLDITFKNEIIKYQEKFPLPKKTDSVFPYYVVSFRKIHNDTIFKISRAFVFSKLRFDNLVIFEDEKLKPTVIYDSDSIGRNFIKKKAVSKRDNLLKSPPPEHQNPEYLYKVNGLKIIFLNEEYYLH